MFDAYKRTLLRFDANTTLRKIIFNDQYATTLVRVGGYFWVLDEININGIDSLIIESSNTKRMLVASDGIVEKYKVGEYIMPTLLVNHFDAIEIKLNKPVQIQTISHSNNVKTINCTSLTFQSIDNTFYSDDGVGFSFKTNVTTNNSGTKNNMPFPLSLDRMLELDLIEKVNSVKHVWYNIVNKKGQYLVDSAYSGGNVVYHDDPKLAYRALTTRIASNTIYMYFANDSKHDDNELIEIINSDIVCDGEVVDTNVNKHTSLGALIIAKMCGTSEYDNMISSEVINDIVKIRNMGVDRMLILKPSILTIDRELISSIESAHETAWVCERYTSKRMWLVSTTINTNIDLLLLTLPEHVAIPAHIELLDAWIEKGKEYSTK